MAQDWQRKEGKLALTHWRAATLLNARVCFSKKLLGRGDKPCNGWLSLALPPHPSKPYLGLMRQSSMDGMHAVLLGEQGDSSAMNGCWWTFWEPLAITEASRGVEDCICTDLAHVAMNHEQVAGAPRSFTLSLCLGMDA